jgi:tripartite-type tricarboxylate transporter receptor subunit TctC
LRALAVMTPQRVHAAHDAAIAEVGLPEAQFDSWCGIVAPTGTPRRIVEQLLTTLRARCAKRNCARALCGRAPNQHRPHARRFMRHMQEEYTGFQSIIRVGGIKPGESTAITHDRCDGDLPMPQFSNPYSDP